MTTLGSRQYEGTNLGRGHQTSRNGVPTPLHYNPPTGVNVLLPCSVSTGFAQVSNCVLSTGSLNNPEGNAQTLVLVTGNGDNLQIVFDITSALVVGVQGTRPGFEFDLYIPPTEPWADRGGSGISFSVRLTDFTNTLAATPQVRQGWQRLCIKASDFVATGGSPVFATTNFSNMRFVMAAKAGVTHIIQMRNFGVMGR